MIIIFDLDYTLLDTKRFKKNLAEAMGISQKVFRDTYYQLGFSQEISYSLEKHLTFLIKRGLIRENNKNIVLKKVLIFLKNINDFLFLEAKNMLTELAKNNHKLILLTYGDPAWQKAKIKNLKIKNLFQRIIITNQAKDNKICFSRRHNEKIIFVNDNVKELLAAKKKWPSIGCILIKGPYSNNAGYNFNRYQPKDIVKIIKRYED
jgi:FMN phosphatase YigB (HAD superfamily)